MTDFVRSYVRLKENLNIDQIQTTSYCEGGEFFFDVQNCLQRAMCAKMNESDLS